MATDDHVVTLLLAGDVMTGRGVDQILPHPSDPELRGIASAGAGRDLEEAARPIRAAISGARGVVIAGMGTESSGIPRAWAAAPSRPGVQLLRDLSPRCADEVAARLRAAANPGETSPSRPSTGAVTGDTRSIRSTWRSLTD